VERAVAAVVRAVRREGDRALIRLTARFDGVRLAPGQLRVPAAEIRRIARRADPELVAALRAMAARIEAFHRPQQGRDRRLRLADGTLLEEIVRPLDSVGLYVPGGAGAYPSSVLMNAIPARVAGVPRIAVVTPPRALQANPAVAAALTIAGIEDHVYRVGGAQAVAALAYGTASIAAVSKIVGPGNAYVAAAKRQVFGQVGIDMIAGPSEVVVIADKDNDPAWIAADLLAQAEHDRAAQAILITDDAGFGRAVAAAVETELATLPRASVARASWESFGAIILVESLDDAPALADRLAPEHLEIATADPESLAAEIRNAGAIFLGRYTPEVIGDYVAGPNHVLPTARSARFASGLGVLDFMKRTSILKLDAASLSALGPAAMTLARAEGLEAHRRSVAIRLNVRD
jgi:histidinol dehydrogenase